MQHSSGPIPVVAHSLPVTYSATPMIAAQAAPTVITTTAQVQEVHSTTNHGAGQAVSAVQLQETEAAMDSDKNAIYRHPLFPLMALLFEKCEQATQTPDCPTSDSFNVDIQSFVHHQEQDGKPFFSDDSELDNLMVKAIQVLRIHLLELEKVNELCKDFCHRYIACLKGKLQSENLLRNDLPGYDSPSPDGSMTSPPPGGPVQMQTAMTPGVVTSVAGNMVFQQNVQQPSVSMATLNQGQIVSGGTVYQMVQTPQGLVAQPIQIQTAAPQIQTTPQVSTAHIIHGSTPLSQIGVPTTPVSTQTTTVSAATVPVSAMAMAAMIDDDDDDVLGKKKNKRGVLPKQATQVMRSWLFQHIVHPYPTEDEKRQIAGQTNLSLLQVNNWFINARRRILQPMLDASNPDQAKVKKNKTQNRPVQRFWPDSIANLQPQVQTQPAASESVSSPEQPATAPATTAVQAAMTTVTTAPQQIIIPHGAIVTADGQIIQTTGGPATVTIGGALLGHGQQSASLGGALLGHGQQSASHVIMVQNGAEQDSQIEPTDLTLDNSDSSAE